MQASQYCNQMGTKFLKVVCDEHGIGGDREYKGDNDAQLGRTNVLYHKASGGKYVPRAVLFDLEHGVIDAAHTSPLGIALSPGHTCEPKRGRGQQLGQGPLHKGWARILLNPP
jgi:tubulin beta